jgi:preprotein translocase subunit SecG
MIAFIITLHIIFCILLIILILIQAGRGGGLVEGFSGVESMFGPKTNVFLTRATTILAILFFTSCVGLAFLSSQQSKSLMRKSTSQEKSVTKGTAVKVNTEKTATATPVTKSLVTPPETPAAKPVLSQEQTQLPLSGQPLGEKKAE